MLEIVTETGSTNADLLARLQSGVTVPEGHWLVADRQTAGRGRQGRSWLDAPGNFMGSTAVQLHAPQEPAPATLSFVAALAVYETVRHLLADAGALILKWPNDVLLHRAKFCGLLLERHGDTVVIGIGVNLAAAPYMADRPSAALGQVGDTPPRDAFATTLAGQFATELRRWREYGLDPILARWRAAAHPPGTPLTVHTPDGTQLSGQYDGLADDGALILRLPDGEARVIHAGDVMLED